MVLLMRVDICNTGVTHVHTYLWLCIVCMRNIPVHPVSEASHRPNHVVGRTYHQSELNTKQGTPPDSHQSQGLTPIRMDWTVGLRVKKSF